ncbi:MAG: hypothetical protein ILO34_04945 [Kiritimatiellae bacterium]|nr:hypothetical protein [Kiritimatiellia bacterium]
MTKKALAFSAIAAILAGCAGKNEAELFGYKGADLEDGEMSYFTTAPTVTNWVPSRVLNVLEAYGLSKEENDLVALAGVVQPGEPLAEIPAGYGKSAEEPWFTTWTRETESFGKKGVAGFISHFDEERGQWETSETYFSSYWPSKDEALAALDSLKAEISSKCAPKRYYDFDSCWVAEYVRLRVMGVVGQKADGTWSCMLDIQDKNRPGCGQWEDPGAQSERLADYKYRKNLAAWKAAKDKAVLGNHEKVEAMRKERGIELFGDSARAFDADDGRKVYVRGGYFDMSNAVEEAVWREKLEGLEKATGTEFSGEISKRDHDGKYSVWGAGWSSDIYEVRLDMAFPADGEKGEWRELCFEIVQDGFSIPPRPKRGNAAEGEEK